MNRQTKVTGFIICLIFAIKLGFVDMQVFAQHYAMLHEKFKSDKSHKIIQPKEKAVQPNYAVLIKLDSKLFGIERLKEGTQVVLASLAGDNYSNSEVPIENFQCRDP